MNKIFDFDKDLNNLNGKSLDSLGMEENISDSIDETTKELNELYQQIKNFSGVMKLIEKDDIDYVNEELEKILPLEYKNKTDISSMDIIVSVIAGFIASVIDIVFVGTPEVVKIYKGGENFDGSIFTKLLRDLGKNEEITPVLKWFSDKCKVPYDVSALKDVVIPDNHRLRNPGHDPLFGLMFAIVDIFMGTATLIDNNGALRVIVREGNYPITEKLFSVIYYVGHLISDVFTSRGLPIPGFFLTQFFVDNKFAPEYDSIAKIAESMYKDGYDLRHLVSMSTPVMIKDLIITIYYYLCYSEKWENIDSIANREISHNKYVIHKKKLILISDAIACSANIVKIFLESTGGNVTALNLPEWISFAKNGMITLKYVLRDKTVEKVIFNRDVIDENWDKLFRNSIKIQN